MNRREQLSSESDVKWSTSFVFVALTLALGLSFSLISADWLQANNSTTDYALLGLRLLTATGMLVTGFASLLKPSSRSIHASFASCTLLILVNLLAPKSHEILIDSWHFILIAFTKTFFVFSYLSFLLRLLRLNSEWLQRPPLLSYIILSCFAFLGYISQSFVNLEIVSRWLGLGCLLAVAMVPIIVLLATAFYKPLRLDQTSKISSMRLRLPSRDTDVLSLVSFNLSIFSGVAGVAFYSINFYEKNSFVSTSISFIFTEISLIIMSISDLTSYSKKSSQISLIERLANQSIRRFLARHFHQNINSAATIGIKTSNFSIDHDPKGDMQAQLPASIMQLRTEEIRRCITDVLGQLHLHSQQFSEQVIGAIDPELSKRPCVDTLKMFATLYLDAAPLVERRIKGLTSLLPIIDPNMVQVLLPKDLDNLFRRNSWFFFLDFTWIDQYLIDAPRGARYDVRMSPLAPQTRLALFEHLHRGGNVGNHVWLGPSARNRLIQEAPSLSHVIEACPIPDPRGDDEHLMFIIRFEQLIPRLQRYFDLDSMRKAILDFEPKPETMRVIQLLSLQISHAPTLQAILDAVASIGSYQWRGFKEKDQALQLLVSAHTILSSNKFAGVAPLQATAPAYLIAHKQILDTIRKIGYPSQMMHDAQQRKINFRNVDLLCQAASEHDNPRFQEAWLLLSVTDFTRCTTEQRRCTIDLLLSLDHRANLMRHTIVQCKSLDILANLGLSAQEHEYKSIVEAFNRTARWFVQRQVDPDIICLLLDVFMFLKGTGFRHISIESTVAEDLDQHLRALALGTQRRSPILKALQSRWQDIRSGIYSLAVEEQDFISNINELSKDHPKAS